MLLTAMGIFLICIGAAFAGALYIATENHNPRPMRVALGYASAVVFIGIGTIIVTGI